MSKFEKSNLTIDGNSVHMSMPFTKVDHAKRTVSGYATLDNIDSQGDVVTAEASAKAFSRARGNLREMHDKVAVGKIVDFREDEYFDAETGELYRGIFVTAYVSKGAESTWEKVVDGTLSGFSIGGEINEASNEFVKEAGRSVRFVKDYDLVELSLVDNPANQLANVFSIQKSATGSVTVSGMVAETVIETVFICKSDDTVTIGSTDSATCPVCETKMENAGWFEAGADRPERVQEIVSKFRNLDEAEGAPAIASEGGVEMAKSNTDETKEVDVVNPGEEFPADGTGTKAETANDEGEQTEKDATEDVDETAGTEEDETASPEEVTDDETEISKKIDELHDAVKDSLEKTREDTAAHIASLEKKIDSSQAEFSAKVSELREEFNQFGQKLETTKSRLIELESSLEKYNSSEAFKKSADLEDESLVKSAGTDVQKPTWNGAFSGKKFSVDNLL